MKHTIVFFLTITLSCLARKETSNSVIALIDTTYRTENCYETLIKLSEAVGITIRFLHPSITLNQDICGCDGILLALDKHFLTQLGSSYAQLTIKPLQNFLKDSNKLLGLLLPVEKNEPHQNQPITQFLKTLGINEAIESDVQTFVKQQQIFKPLYTTQYYIAGKTTLPTPVFINAQVLPTKKLPSYLVNNYPIALLIKTEQHNLFISTIANMTFSDLEEDNTRNPIDPNKRKELLNATVSLLDTLSKKLEEAKETKKYHHKKNILNKLVNKKHYRLNYSIYKKQSGIFKWVSNGISCGWLSIDYNPKLMKKNLASIAQTEFDMLWLELPISLYKKSDEFDKKINLFTQELRNAYQKESRSLPKIFIDFDFGATLHWCTDSSHPRDIYGNEYHHVPAPLDYKEFWRPCILTVLKDICTRWEKNIGNNVPINGILFNFYFWNSKEMPFYSNLVDFSDSAWNAYKKYHNVPPAPTHKERINYVIQHNKLPEYFLALEQEACELATLITNDIHTLLPCAMIGCYTHTPIDTWFYRGFTQQLGSKQNPLLWFTSNLNYYGHQKWIKCNNIHALHVTNIRLDHFNDSHDIHMINKLAQTHDGLWYSRASRIGEKYQPNKWWSAEATTCKPKKLIKLINKQAHKK